jgi:hypothetical protein
MEYRSLGRSGLEVSVISFGCMSLKTSLDRDNVSLMHRALDLGINLIDTADLYDKGMNEEWVGKAIMDRRDKVILATKVGNQWRNDGSGWDWNPTKEYILSAVEDSLRRLRTDRIDLYQLHGGTIDDPIDETIDAFETLIKQGKILHYGISSIRPNVIRAYAERSRISSVMMQYSLVDRRPEEEMLNFLQHERIGVLVRGALAQGMLIAKPGKDILGHRATEIDKARHELHDSVQAGRTPAQTAILFASAHPAVGSVVVGMGRSEQLEEAVAATNKISLSSSEMEFLHGLLTAGKYDQHR